MNDHTDVLNEYTAGGWDYPDTDAMAHEITRLRTIIERIRGLHRPYGAHPQWCTGCDRTTYPCRTITTLEELTRR